MTNRLTVRNTFRKGDLLISYSNPSIQPHRESKEVSEENNPILYFYYDIDILYKGKTIFQSRPHDFPKVDSLGFVIESILSEDDYAIEFETGDESSYHRTDYYKRVVHEELFEREYGYVFEAEKVVYKQAKDPDYTTNYYYKMRLSVPNSINGRWGINGVRSCIQIDMTKEDLLKLKTVSEAFVKNSMEQYNSYDLPSFLEWLEEHPQYKED